MPLLMPVPTSLSLPGDSNLYDVTVGTIQTAMLLLMPIPTSLSLPVPLSLSFCEDWPAFILFTVRCFDFDCQLIPNLNNSTSQLSLIEHSRNNADMPPAGVSTAPISDRFAFYKAREGSSRRPCHPGDGSAMVAQPCPGSNR